MATVLDTLITPALKEIGVCAAGETPSSEDSADALLALNRYIGQLASQKDAIYSVVRTTWTIVSGSASYTVGTGGTVNIARPVFIDHVNLIDTTPNPDVEFPMDPLTEDAYSAYSVKPLTSVLPQFWYYNPTFPLGTLYLLPIPTSSSLQGAIYAPTAVTSFAAITTSVSLPPAYEEMIVTNLALKLATPYGRQPDPLLFERAKDATAIVKRANKRLSDLSFEAGALIQGPGWSTLDFRSGP